VARERYVAGLDIGTTKVCAVIGVPTDRGGLQIVGVGTAPSKGIKRGVVVDREATIEAIQRSMTEARNMAARPVRGAYVGITGDHIESLNVTGRVHTGPSGEVNQDVIAQTWVIVGQGLDRFKGDEMTWRSWVFATARRAEPVAFARRSLPALQLTDEDAAPVSRTPPPGPFAAQVQLDEPVLGIFIGAADHRS